MSFDLAVLVLVSGVELQLVTPPKKREIANTSNQNESLLWGGWDQPGVSEDFAHSSPSSQYFI